MDLNKKDEGCKCIRYDTNTSESEAVGYFANAERTSRLDRLYLVPIVFLQDSSESHVTPSLLHWLVIVTFVIPDPSKVPNY